MQLYATDLFPFTVFFLTTPHKSYILIIVCKLVNVRETEGGIKNVQSRETGNMLKVCTLTNNQPINLVVLAENKAHNCHWFESIKVNKILTCRHSR